MMLKSCLAKHVDTFLMVTCLVIECLFSQAIGLGERRRMSNNLYLYLYMETIAAKRNLTLYFQEGVAELRCAMN